MKKDKYKLREHRQPWLVTFTDMTLIMLVLFILLYSFSSMDFEKFQSVTESFQEQSLGSGGDDDGDGDGVGDASIPEDLEDQFAEIIERQENIEEILKYVLSYAEEHDLEEQMTVSPTDEGIEVVLPEVMLFPSGQADLLDEAIAFLDNMAPLLSNIPNRIEVEGHTDNRPISTERFPSNWDLSTARANEVIRYLIDVHNLNPERFRSVGYGEYRPVTTNRTEEGRSQNRRVVMMILNEEEQQEESEETAEVEDS